MHDDGSGFVLFGSLDKTKFCKDIVEGIGWSGRFLGWGEDSKEVIEVMRDRPAEIRPKDPMYCFREEIEDTRCGPETKWEEQLHVEDTIPFEDETSLVQD